jgi:hypothetical protein
MPVKVTTSALALALKVPAIKPMNRARFIQIPPPRTLAPAGPRSRTASSW